MNSAWVKINLLICVALILVFSGCASMFGKTSSASPEKPVANDKYSKEIVELNHVVRQDSQSSKAKKAHLKLARLHSDHNNRRRDYRKALEHLEAYIILDDSDADDDTMNWMAALKEIDRLSKEINQVQKQLKKTNKAKIALKRTNKKLTREEIKLREQNRLLEESNQKLEKTIEMLKNLDRRLEEKRRNFNN